MPDRGTASLTKCLLKQLNLHAARSEQVATNLKSRGVANKDMKVSQRVCYVAVAATRPRVPIEEDKLFLHIQSAENFQLLIEEMNWAANPGHPYCLRWPTKGAMREDLGDEVLRAMVEDRLKALRGNDLDKKLNWLRGVVDLIRVFVKNEPHKIAKVLDDRLRMICSVSIIDELVMKSIYQPLILTLKQITTATRVFAHAQICMGFTLEHSAKFRKHISMLSSVGPVLFSDVSNMDFSQTQYAEESFNSFADLWYNEHLSVDTRKLYRDYALAISTAFKYKCYVVPDGKVFRATHPGITMSGSPITTIYNTMCRVLVGMQARLDSGTGHWRAVLATGDNAAEVTFDDPIAAMALVANYAFYGYTLSDLVVHRATQSDFEYCSHKYEGLVKPAYPVKWQKAVVKLLVTAYSNENYAAFIQEFSGHPEFERALGILNKFWRKST